MATASSRWRVLRGLIPVLAWLGAGALAAPPAAWESRGPGGGGAMYAPTINPDNPRELYVACDMSPQFHSVDGGHRWTTLDFRQLQSGHACAVRFTRDPRIRWALDYTPVGGGDTVRPRKSTDGGATWQLCPEAAWPAGRTAYALYADYRHPERVVVSADYKQLWVTRDGGASFAQVAAVTGPGGLHLAGCVFDGDTIYAGTNDGVYVSTDGGASFAKREYPGLPAGETPVAVCGARQGGTVRLYCVTAAQAWAGITGSEHNAYRGVYTLDAGQDRWVKRVDGIDPGAHPWFVQCAANNTDVAYLAGGGTAGAPTVYKTTDGGAHWRSVFLTAGNRNIVTGWAGDNTDFRWSYPEYALGFDVSPSDPNVAVITDLGCAHRTTDGGATWVQVYTRLTAPRAPGDAVRGAAYLGGGLEMTSVWQLTWLDAQRIVAAITDIKGARSTDGGITWSFDYRGHALNTMYGTARRPGDNRLFAATSSVHDLYMSTYLADARIDRGAGLVLTSADGGATWTTLKDFHHPVAWVALDPTRANRLYAAVVHSGEGGLYVTDTLDQGAAATWTKLPNPPRTEGHPYNIRVLRDGTLACTFAGRRVGNGFTPSSGVFVSTDGGATWDDRSDPGMRFWTKDLILDDTDPRQDTWYACVCFAWGAAARGGKSGLYRTRDRGRTWTLLADSTLSPTGVLNVESCAVDPRHPNDLYFTTEYDGLWYTANRAADRPTFTPVASYPFRHPLRIQFAPDAPTAMWVTSFGNGMCVGTTRE